MYPLLDNLKHTTTGNFFLIAGPCVIEDETTPFLIAERLFSITERLGIPFAFKASYRKANRSRIDSFTGIGDQAGLDILQAIRQRFGIPVVTDIHSEPEAAQATPTSTSCRFQPSSADRPPCSKPLRRQGAASTSRKASSSRPKP